MTIASLQKTSLIDYPDKISAIVFTQGCNLRCGFCYNRSLVVSNNKVETDYNLSLQNNKIVETTRRVVSTENILTFLASRQHLLDAVVITGGEPTLQTGLSDFIKQIKNLGYLIKLDTNGLRPNVVADLLKQNLLDYVAMDIKAPLEKYSELMLKNVETTRRVVSTMQNKNIRNKNFVGNKNFCSLQQSIKIIINYALDYEFRSTLIKGWHRRDDIEKMARMIRGAKKYFLQKFVPQPNLLNPKFKKYQPFSLKEMQNFANQALKYVKKCEIRY